MRGHLINRWLEFDIQYVKERSKGCDLYKPLLDYYCQSLGRPQNAAEPAIMQGPLSQWYYSVSGRKNSILGVQYQSYPPVGAVASTCSLKGREKLGADRTGALHKRSLAASKADLHSYLHTNLCSELKKSVRGETTEAIFCFFTQPSQENGVTHVCSWRRET